MTAPLLRRHPLPALLALFALLVVGRFVIATLPIGHGRNTPVGIGDGTGVAEIDPATAVLAGSRGTWRIRYVAGSSGIQIGGGVVIQVSPYWGWSVPQTESPDSPGYTTVRTSGDRVRLAVSASTLHYVVVTVLEKPLAAGDTLVLTYGDTGGGEHAEAAAQADLYAERSQEFVVKVDGDGDGRFAEIARSPAVEITPRDPTRLVVNGRATARPGKPFRATVAFLDPFDNRATGALGTVALESDDPAARLPPTIEISAADSGARSFEVTLFGEGPRRIRAVERDRGLRAESPPIVVRRDSIGAAISPSGSPESPILLWGDLHGHSGFSDGTGTPRDYYRYARDVTNLDICALTDHDHHGLRPLPPEAWREIVAAADDANAPDSFVTFVGYEWTNWPSGHRNVYFGGADGALLSVADSVSDTPDELWAALDSLGLSAMTIAHHPAGEPAATDWSITPPPRWEMLVEISSAHGSSESPGCPNEVRDAKSGSYVFDALARGHRLGFIGSGDGHTGHPGKPYGNTLGGLAGVYASARTRAAVWEALRARRVFATSGARILLEFDADGTQMGGELLAEPALRGAVTFRVRVVGSEPIERIDLIRDGRLLARKPCAALEDSFAFVDEGPKRAGSWTYARAVQVDGETAWSSPIWFGAGPESRPPGARPRPGR